MSSPYLILGHKPQQLQLRQDLSAENLSHAYLFAGAAHVGKTTVAHWFAREILTQGLSDDEGREVVRQMDKLIHPDFLVLDQLWMEEKMEDWDAIAKTSNISQVHRSKKPTAKSDIIGIDDVRTIQDRLQETGNLPRRVCIIRNVERMNDAAANAFLKILEEPPEGRVFIFTSETLTSLLPTIVSRTRVLRFERVADREIQAMLQDVPEEDASFIVHVAQGAPGVAFTLMSDPEAMRKEKMMHTQAVSFWGGMNLHDRLHQLESLDERGEEADRFLFHLSLALREVPDYKTEHERALMDLMKALSTNAHRQLLIQRFALSI